MNNLDRVQKNHHIKYLWDEGQFVWNLLSEYRHTHRTYRCTWTTKSGQSNVKLVYNGESAVCLRNDSCCCQKCQLNFNFVFIQSQINVRTARFLQKFIVTENSLVYSLFANNAALSQITITGCAVAPA